MPVDVAACVAALDDLVRRVEVSEETVPEDGAEELKRIAQGNAPKLSGQLAASIVIVQNGPGSRLVGPTVVYGRIRELGGRIPQHPMSHPFLRWYSGGHWVFKRSVHQHGTHYMKRSLETYEPRYQNLAYDEWATVTRIA